MESSALLDLAEIRHRAITEVGAVSKDLLELKKHNLPIPRTAIVPQSTLEKIAIKAQLGPQLKQALKSLDLNLQQEGPTQAQELEFLQQARRIVRQLRLPAKISQEILAWYQQQPGFYRVATADKELDNTQEHHHVIGDANLLDSILAIWSEQLKLDLDQRQLKLFAPPILLQFQGQPEISGVAYTQAPAQKTQLLLRSVWGVHQLHDSRLEPDEYLFDLRTQQITRHQLQPQAVMLKRASDKLVQKSVLHYKQQELSLTLNQARELGRLIATVKRLTFKKQRVRWFYQNGQFYLAEFEPFSAAEERELNHPRQVLLHGQSLQNGIVSGQVKIVSQSTQIKSIQAGQVLVVPTLKRKHLEALNQATALICNHGLANPSLQAHIKTNSIPTLINTKHATRRLEDGQTVLVNANAGQILALNHSQKQPTLKSTQTITKVYIAAGNPLKAQEYVNAAVDGVGILRSEYTYAKLGTHPMHLIRSHKKKLLKQKLTNTIRSFQAVKPNLPVIYRSQNLTSQELSMLERAGRYEEKELNPYLGFRGGLQLLRRFELLDLEATILTQVLNSSPSPIGLMLPFIRTPSELQLIVKHLQQKHSLFEHSNFSLYLQLNTPSNIAQLKHYLSTASDNLVAGVSLDVRSLHTLYYGIDPTNPELFSLYPYDLDLMKEILTQVITAVRAAPHPKNQLHPHPKAILQLQTQHLSLVELATELGFDAVTVKPEFAPRVKNRIKELEMKKINQV